MLCIVPYIYDAYWSNQRETIRTFGFDYPTASFTTKTNGPWR
jgi:hypothetical protein